MDIKLTLKSNNRTLEIGNDTSYKLISIEGIDSGSLELNTVSNAQFDGSVVVSKRIQNRPISITVDYKGTNSQEVERQSLISFFNPKNKGVLIINYGEIERAIEYEIEGFNCKLNSIFDTVSFTVDFICSNPYWRDIVESKINIAMWRGMFHFPLIMPSTIVPHSGTDSTWKDLSGNLNNGLLSGFNYDATSGWTTEGLKFDNDSYVTLPSLDLQEGTIQVNNQVVTFDKDTDYRTTSDNSNILSLNTTVDGVMDVEVGGNTLQNLLGDAGNCEALSKWAGVGAVLDSTIKLFGSNSFKFTPNNYNPYIYQEMLCDQTHKYFISGHAYIASYTSGSVVIEARDYGASTNPIRATFDSSILNKWQRASVIVTGRLNGGMRVYVGSSAVLTTATYYIDGVMVYDLTAIYGVGKEPTDIAKLESELPYFEGIRSVGESENLEVVSCGSNLFNKNSFINAYTDTSGNLVPNQTYKTFEVVLKKDITYYFGGVISGKVRIRRFLNNKYLGLTDVANYTLLSGLDFVRVEFSEQGNDYPNIDIFQVKPGTSSTTYEPYKEHRQPILLTNPLRGLPNGVRDIAKGDVVTRNVGKVVLNGSESWQGVSWSTSNLQNTIPFRTLVLKNVAKSQADLLCNLFNKTENTNLSLKDFEYLVIDGVSDLTLNVLKSKLPTQDIAGLKAWLQANPVTVYYQLTTPTTENLAQALKLKSFSNGTLQVNTLIPPYLSANYPITLGGSLASNVSRIELSNPLIITGQVKNYRVYNKILTVEEVARANTSDYLKGPSLLVDLSSAYKELSKTGIIMGLREPSLIVNALNTGNVESGMIIEFKALGTLTNPSILNVETQEFFKINKSMVAGEIITVNTNVGAKKVIDNLNGVETNILNLIDLDSTFLQLKVGDNLLRYDADTNLNNLEISVFYNPFYLGV